MSTKGKEIDTSGGKRKRSGGDDNGGDDDRKRKNRAVLQFFEDSADVDEDEYETDFSDFDDEEEFDIELKLKKEPVKIPNIPVIPKEEVMDEEEFDKMMDERYMGSSSFVRYAEDAFEAKLVERDSIYPTARDPTIWKVKCMVGRERHSAFCLMQKFVDLRSLGTKLQIISAFSVDHVKGFVFIEADKQCDINEACKGLCSIYSTRVAPIPKNEVTHVLSVRSKSNVISEGMWVRVKNGKYKGDLAQIVAVNDTRKRATVKLIPRIDLQALAQKFGGGVSMKNAATPAPRLISSNELEEFRPLVQYRRDRDTGLYVQVLDGLMLKDGFLYKRVSVDSLSCWGVVPSEEELLKFQPAENIESDNTEWLKQLYGSPKKKRIIGNDKGGEKGESSSASGSGNNFELYDLVCFSRKDFGVIVDMEKDDYYKILKDRPEAPVVVTVARREVKSGPSDMRFTALDRRRKTISINDTVKVVEGPLKDRQGIVKQIYRGIIFIYDQNETVNGGYFCSKAQLCEKVKLSFDMCTEKGGESGSFDFEDFPSSPKSPLSPKRPLQIKDNNQDFNRGEKDGMFSIGQTLRIRVGPLKGYLCRVLAIRYSDVTVKLDSKQKVLTVKSEHLSELRGKSSAMPASEDPGSSSFKPFDLLGTAGGSTGWTDGVGTSAEGDGWNAGGVTTESNSWSSFPSSGSKLQPDSSGFVGDDAKEVDAWGRKATSNQNSSWGAAADHKVVDKDDQAHGWGKSEDCWNKAPANIGSSSGASGGWGKAILSSANPADSSKDSGDGWGQPKLDAAAGWDKGKNVAENPTSSWGDVTPAKNQKDSWSSKDVAESGSWEKSKSSSTGEDNWNKGAGWNQQNSQNKGDTWGNTAEAQNNNTVQGDSWGKANDISIGGKPEWNSTPTAGKPTETWGSAGGSLAHLESKTTDETSDWMKGKVDGASQTANWSDQKNQSPDVAGWTTGGSSGQNQTDNLNKPKTFGADGGSSWGKQVAPKTYGSEGGSSWNKKDESSWGKQDGVSKQEESSWNKQDGGSKQEESSWGKQDGGSFNKVNRDQEFGAWNTSSAGGRGRGSDGRRGRGGGWGGRDHYGRGKSFGEGQSSGWNRGEENNRTGDGSSKNPPAWSNDQAGGWGKKPDSSWGDDGSRWNKNQVADTKANNSGDRWNNSKPSFEAADQSGWGSKPESSGQKSNWNQESGEIAKESENRDHRSGWNGESNDSDWGRKGNWNSRSGDSGGNAGSSWGKKSNLNIDNSDANQNSGWGKKSNWNSGAGDASQESSGWGKKSSWNQDSFAAGGEGQNETSGDRTGGGSWRGGFGGRGGSDRGGFRGIGERGGFGGRNGSDRGGYGGRGRSDRGGSGGGRGWSDRGGFGGRGGSDRGSFGGRARSDRGGFGGRGRRDSGGDWNNSDSGDWKNGANNNSGGWKSSGGGSWNQGGEDNGQSLSWNSGSGGTSNQASGWSSQGSGWSQSGKAKDGEAKTWNQSSGSQSSDWNHFKEANEGANTSGEPTDSCNWGKKGDSTSSKGGW